MVQLDIPEKYNTALKIHQPRENHPLQMQVTDTQ